jgi:HD-GYP domain-containing protein (c-di-GMP phosphodiesterase class II)
LRDDILSITGTDVGDVEIEKVEDDSKGDSEDENQAPKVKVEGPFNIIELGKKVDAVLAQVNKSPKLVDLFNNLNVARDRENYLKEHIGLLINITTAISKHMDWSSQQTLEKFVYASYLHDYAIRNSPGLAKIQTEAEIEPMADLISDEDKELILNHPILASEELKQYEEIPEDVFAIIEQHHETPEGTGFPKKVDFNRITQLSALFIIAHEITTAIMSNKKWKMENIVSDLEKKYKTGPNFKKIIRALKKLKF